MCFNINMINLSLDQLKLVAPSRNIRDYKNKSKNDLIKVLSKLKPKIKLIERSWKKSEKIFTN